MGLNFFLKFNICEHCERGDTIHIGKASAGWQFIFHGTEKLKSISDWQILTKFGIIEDEYHAVYSFQMFWDRVNSSKHGLNHLDVLHSTRELQPGEWKDAEGWCFIESEFS